MLVSMLVMLLATVLTCHPRSQTDAIAESQRPRDSAEETYQEPWTQLEVDAPQAFVGVGFVLRVHHVRWGRMAPGAGEVTTRLGNC